MSFRFARALAALAVSAPMVSHAGDFAFLGIEAEYQLQATYALGVRTEKPHDGIINTPPVAEDPAAGLS